MRFFLIFFLSLNFLYADVVLNDSMKKIDKFEMAYFYDDASLLSINEVSKIDFNQTRRNQFALAYAKGNSWFKLVIENNSTKENFLLHLAMPWFDIVNVYTLQSGNFIVNKNGLSTLFKNREIPDTDPTFHLHIKKAQKKIFYIQMNCKFAGSGDFTIYLDKASFVKDKIITIGLYMIYFGGSIIVIVLNLFLFFTLREKIYIYYSFYVFTLASFVMVMAGISGFLFHDSYYKLNFLPALNMLFFVLFAKEILQTKKFTPKLNKILNIFAVGFALFTPLLFIAPFTWFRLFNLVLVIALFFILFTSIFSWRERNEDAKYYIIFMLIYISTLMIFSLLALGVLEYSYFTRYVYIYASFFEITFFALVLANRFNKTKKEKVKVEMLLDDKEIYEKELENISNRDALTGLYNRRYLTNISVKLFEQLNLNKDNLCILMLDIDHFKSVNDSYGHLVGDTILKNVAKTLSSFSREKDIVVRYGGEEFLIIISNTKIKDAKIFAKNLRKSIEELETFYEKEKFLKVTISIGLTQSIENDTSIESIIDRADKGLYISKNEGRNRVSMVF